MSAAALLAQMAEPWRRDALCLEYPASPWCEDGKEAHEECAEVCAGCLVRDECLSFAVDEEIYVGTWGGTTGPERRALRKAERRL